MALIEDTLLFLDCETSGLNPTHHDIIEIAAILTDLQMNEIDRFESKVRLRNPDRMEPDAAKVNGYDMEVWAAEAKPFHHFQGWLDKHTPYGHVTVAVGHNVGFDRDFIETYYKPCGKFLPISYHKIDTAGLGMAMKVSGVIDVPDVKLQTVMKAIGITGVQTHRAMDDCEAAKKVFEFVVEMLRA